MRNLPLVMVLAMAPSLASAEPLSLAFERPVTPAIRPLVLTAAVDPTEPAPASDRAVPVDRPRTIFGLPKNVGTIDRVVRVAVGATLLGLGAWGLASDSHLGDTTSYVLMGVSAVPFATAATGYCPLYQALGIERTR